MTRCSLGVGCDEAGVCYAAAHGRPEMCGAQAIEARRATTPTEQHTPASEIAGAEEGEG